MGGCNEKCCSPTEKYLREGGNRSVLKKYKGIGAGFSNSDIEYIYIKK